MSNNKTWTIENHQISEDTSATGIARGTLKFTVDGEVNADIQLEAVNDNVISSGNGTISSHIII